MLFTALDWLLSLPVDHSRQSVALKWALDWCQLYFFAGKYIFSELINFVWIRSIYFKSNQIKLFQNTKQYTFHWLMCIWIVGGGSSNRNVSRDESVETGDESVETGDESIEAGERHNNHAVYCQKMLSTSLVPECQRNNIEEHGPDGKKFRWKFDKTSTIFIKQKTFENDTYITVVIMYRPSECSQYYSRYRRCWKQEYNQDISLK